MNLETLYQQLSFGELRNISIGNEGNGTIRTDFRPALVMHANEALTRIHSQFMLRENDLLIRMYQEITNYHMISRFAVNAGNVGEPEDQEEIRYILDLPNEPFKDDFIKPIKVFTQNGRELAINDENNPYGVFTPQTQLIQMPTPTEGEILSVQYQADHPKLSHERPTDLIFLPPTLEPALKAYVAYKVYGNMNQQDSIAKSQEYLATYQGICDEVLMKDLVSQTPSTHYNTFSIRGWV